MNTGLRRELSKTILILAVVYLVPKDRMRHTAPKKQPTALTVGYLFKVYYLLHYKRNIVRHLPDGCIVFDKPCFVHTALGLPCY